MEFGYRFRELRKQQGLTQSDVASATGIARPNIAAYEAGRREPKISTAEALLDAVGASLVVPEPIVWTWTSGPRPYPVPSRLWRLPIDRALTTITTASHLWWSGPPRTFDLHQAADQQRAYEIVLREGTPTDIEQIVDGLLLITLWNDLVLPADLRQAWQPIISAASGPARERSDEVA